MRRPWHLAAACWLTAAALLAGACTRPADQRDEAITVAAGPTAGADNTGTSIRGGAAAEGAGVAATAEAIAAGDFGSLKNVCGPAAAGVTNSATGSQGVSADEVIVGTFSDPDNKARPGVNQELFDVANVFAAWCNDLGGIAGRRVKVNEHDSGLFNVAPAIADACATDFYIVGGGSVLDDIAVKPRLECLLPQISGFQVTNEARLADLQVQPQSLRADELQAGPMHFLQDKFPDAISKFGAITGNLPALQLTVGQYRTAAEILGWTEVFYQQYNAAGESTWTPYAADIKGAGVRLLAYSGEPENLALLVKALANTGAELDGVIATPNAYDQKLIVSAGAALDKIPVYLGISTIPFENAASSPPMQEFLALFEKYLPKGRSNTLLALNSMSAWLLFAHAATECGAELTRRCVYENSKKPMSWDAGGLFAPTDVKGGYGGSKCFVSVRATSKGFVVEKWRATTGVFNCDDKNVMKLPGNYPVPVMLSDVGKSLADLK